MKYLVRFINIAFYTLLCLVLFVGAIIHGGGLWLSSDSGSTWVKSQINGAMADSGYTVNMGDVNLSFMGINISTLSIEGEDGLRLSASDVDLQFNPFPLTFKILNVSIMAEQFTIAQLPESVEEEEADEPSQTIEIPDIFFNKINLTLNVDALRLPDSDFSIGIDIEQSLIQDDNQNLSLEGQNRIIIAGQDLLPAQITNDVFFNGSDVTINAVELSHPVYDLGLNGQYNIVDNRVDLNIEGETSLLAQMVAPDLDALTLAGNLQGEISNITGDLALNTVFKDQDLNLSTDVVITDEAVTLQNIDGLATQLSVSGEVRLPYETALAEGELSFQTVEPEHLLAIMNIDQDIAGVMAAEVRLEGRDGQQAVDLNGRLTNVEWQGMTIQSADIEASIDNVIEAEIPDISLSVNNLQYDTTTIQSATGEIAITDEGQYQIALRADGQNIQPFTFEGSATIRQVSPLSIDIPAAALILNEGRIDLQGSLTEEAVAITVKGNSIAPSSIPFIAMGDVPINIQSVNISANGRPDQPVINGDYAILTIADNAPQITINGNLGYNNQRATMSAAANGEGVERLTVNVGIPLQLSLYPFAFNIAESAALDGDLIALLDIVALQSFLPDNSYELSGNLEVQADLAGTIDNIQINGNADIISGRFYDPVSSLILQDINGGMNFDRNRLTISSLTATGADERGRLELDGAIGLENLAEPDISLNLDVQNMHILSGPPYDVWLNADVSFESQADNYLLSGDLSLGEVVVQLPENQPSSIPELNIIEPEQDQNIPFLERIRLDLTFQADDKIFIRGYGVDTEMAGDLTITGMASDPQVNGDLTSIRGRYEDFGRQFDLEQAILRFQGSIPPSPYLDIIASVRVDDVVAKVNLGGTPTSPQVSFTSSPALPEDEVLSHILFGEDISTISPFQAIQLANTLRRLSGRGGGPNLNILGGIRDATGLDDLRIEGSGENARVGAGKYIADDVYLDVSKGAGEESGTARIEVELTPSVSVESKVGQTGESDSNIFWRWDY